MKAIVTFYVTRGRKLSTALNLIVFSAGDVKSLVQRTAEAVFGQINPYVLAVYLGDNNDQNTAIELCRKLENEDTNHIYKIAAFNLWGNALQAQGENDEADKLFKKALQLR